MITITLNDHQPDLWDGYLEANSHASVYHRHAFRSVVERTYGHAGCYFLAREGERAVGVLPLFHVKSVFLGDSLVSLPFCDYGGVLADSDAISHALLLKGIEQSKKLKCRYLELRQTSEVTMPGEGADAAGVRKDKVRMRLCLPETADALLAGFTAKLRSQIRKPQKEGCTLVIGGEELLDDFYSVFVHNMRDLGSPVHSRKMMLNMLRCYGEDCRLFVVHHSGRPVACSLTVGFKDTLVNPWASFKRTSQKIAPNMLLYWEMLRYAIESGYRFFDFGRSTRDEGTYRFKAQWGAEPEQLFWYRSGASGHTLGAGGSESREMYVRMWRMLPLPLTRVIGPILRKQLHL